MNEEAEILAGVMFDEDKEVVNVCSMLLDPKDPRALLMSSIRGGLYRCNLCGCGLFTTSEEAIRHLRREHYADALRKAHRRFVAR